MSTGRVVRVPKGAFERLAAEVDAVRKRRGHPIDGTRAGVDQDPPGLCRRCGTREPSAWLVVAEQPCYRPGCDCGGGVVIDPTLCATCAGACPACGFTRGHARECTAKVEA